MTATELIASVTGGGVAAWLGKFAFELAKDKLFQKHRSVPPISITLPKSSESSDKMKAIAGALEQAETIKKIDSLHAALAKQNPNTGAYVVLETLVVMKDHAEKQTAILDKQTDLLRQIAGPQAPKVGRY
jgi:hypothetical protein